MKKVLICIVASLLFQASFVVSAFEIQDFNGSKVNLDDKIGQKKWSLVMFWAHDCGICRAEFPLYSDFHNRRNDIDVIGISIDGEENKHLAQAFLDQTQPSFSSYISNLLLVSVNYQVITEESFRGTPTFLLFSPDGKLLGNNPGKLSISALETFINNNSI